MSAETLFLKDEKGVKHPKILSKGLPSERGGICPHKTQFSPFCKIKKINSAIFAACKQVKMK